MVCCCSQSVCANASLACLGSRFARLGIVGQAAEEEAVREQLDELATRRASLQQMASTLSGGNQQKVLVARWLLRDAEVLLFDEPTRGIDVAARRRIYRLLESLAEAGKTIVLASATGRSSRRRVTGCWCWPGAGSSAASNAEAGASGRSPRPVSRRTLRAALPLRREPSPRAHTTRKKRIEEHR